MKYLIIISCIALCKAQNLGSIEAQAEPISPYSFSYSADATDGSSARQESADASGVVRGSYSISSADGIKRVVNYIADQNGFRAQVQTNEPGTESKSSADVIMQSSQLPAEEIAKKVGPRPFEQKLVTPVLGLKTIPQSILLSRPVIDQTLFQQKVLQEIPLQRKLETTLSLPEELLPSIQFTSKQIESPIKLLSKIPRIQNFRPIALDLQKREELAQTFERY